MVTTFKQTLLAILSVATVMLSFAGCRHFTPQPVSYNDELAYLKAVNAARPPEDPLVALLLMLEFQNSNRLAEGIAFYEALLQKHDANMSKTQRARYLSYLGVLRALYAKEIPLLKRIGWVNETISLLETARELTGNEDFIVRFSTGVVYAQLPKMFKKREQAYRDLEWAVEHRNESLEQGLLREVYLQLARLHDDDDRPDQARFYLARSGYDDFEQPLLLVTNYAANLETGHTFHPRKLQEVVPGRIYAISGVEFTEYHFIISDNGKELIAIDAGTRPDSARDAYEVLREHVGKLPPLTTVFVTHAHWDHIGGHRFYRELNPKVVFYSRVNYREELNRVIAQPVPFHYFFGTRYGNHLITDYRPDITIGNRSEVRIGGTRFDLIPIPGGETPDGMFVYLPEYGVLFVGDFIMPYIGSPYHEEGDIPGLLEAMEIVVSTDARHLLHGHEPLTRYWDSVGKLARLRSHLAWLYEETLTRIRAWKSRSSIHRENLMPPSLEDTPELQLVYLIMRENFINRVFDQETGYRKRDLTGLDHLGPDAYGAALAQYLGISERRLATAVGEMLRNGDYHLAQRISEWGLTQYNNSEPLADLRRQAFLKLKEKYQFIDPFKVIAYSEMAGDETRQLELGLSLISEAEE